jgi:hypothetical protein
MSKNVRRFAHRVQRRPRQKSRSGLTQLASMRIHGAKNPLRHRNVDSCRFVSELAEVDIDNRPSPAAIAALAA